jgi:hypothetical protein
MPDNTQVGDLLGIPAAERSPDWLKQALQVAVRLEFATIPPYLCAMWSIKSEGGPVYDSIREIVIEEMLHMGLVCNLLTTFGDTPRIWPEAPPSIPHRSPVGFVRG